MIEHRTNPESLLIAEDLSWRDEDVPIEDRGVDGAWVDRLTHGVQAERNWIMKQYWFHRKAADWFDNVPEPVYPQFMDEELNAHAFVRDHVIPWTQQSRAPLFARVPHQRRRKPTTFLSYAWSATLLADGYGVVQAFEPYLGAGSFVWWDLVCHNQHHVGSVARQVERVVASVELVVVPMSSAPWYSRAWCIWEVLCAIRHGKRVAFAEYARRLRDYREIRRHFLETFSSIAECKSSLSADKDEILSAVVETFGSVAEADRRFIAMMRESFATSP